MVYVQSEIGKWNAFSWFCSPTYRYITFHIVFKNYKYFEISFQITNQVFKTQIKCKISLFSNHVRQIHLWRTPRITHIVLYIISAGPVTRKVDPHFLFPPGPNISKYLDPWDSLFQFRWNFWTPRNKNFWYIWAPLKYFIPLEFVALNTLCKGG